MKKILLAAAIFMCGQCFASTNLTMPQNQQREKVLYLGAVPGDFCRGKTGDDFVDNLRRNIEPWFMDTRVNEVDIRNEQYAESLGKQPCNLIKMNFQNVQELINFARLNPNKFYIIANDYCVSYYIIDYLLPYFIKTLKPGGRLIIGPIMTRTKGESWLSDDPLFNFLNEKNTNNKLFADNSSICENPDNNSLSEFDTYWDISKYANNADVNGKLLEVDNVTVANPEALANWKLAADINFENIKKSILKAFEKKPELFSDYKRLQKSWIDSNALDADFKLALIQLHDKLDENDPFKVNLKKFLELLDSKNKQNCQNALQKIYDNLSEWEWGKSLLKDFLDKFKFVDEQNYLKILSEFSSHLNTNKWSSKLAGDVRVVYNDFWRVCLPKDMQTWIKNYLDAGGEFNFPNKKDYMQTPEDRKNIIIENLENMKKNMFPSNALKFLQEASGCSIKIEVFEWRNNPQNHIKNMLDEWLPRHGLSPNKALDGEKFIVITRLN